MKFYTSTDMPYISVHIKIYCIMVNTCSHDKHQIDKIKTDFIISSVHKTLRCPFISNSYQSVFFKLLNSII